MILMMVIKINFQEYLVGCLQQATQGFLKPYWNTTPILGEHENMAQLLNISRTLVKIPVLRQHKLIRLIPFWTRSKFMIIWKAKDWIQQSPQKYI